ncbi:MAG: hypothetical protein ACFFBX_02175 [Promethearchaeota archaeon]
MSVSSQSPQLRMAGWILTLIGGIVIIGSQAYGFVGLFTLMAMIPSLPPEYTGLLMLSLQIYTIYLAAAVTMGVLVLIATLIIYMKREKLGGILAIIFAIPLFIISGLFGWIGAILAIIGGALSLASTMKPAEPEPEVI